ncbi:MAG: hypothetical protein E7J94_08920 [Clostridium sp.]|uniref:hypothetical protein n=1 Tax=Clostridia TaxID=186801 RepID=UPI00067F207B|nr:MULTISPECIES: hypothetical protein [Clostridia]MBS6764242.1 hypothetical protein [Clostridium sp.]MDU7707382.1 hypothetical protein [Clostridium sp.]
MNRSRQDEDGGDAGDTNVVICRASGKWISGSISLNARQMTTFVSPAAITLSAPMPCSGGHGTV